MPVQLQLIPADTRMEASADGASFNISESATRTFLCRLTVTDQIEQESLDVSIWGSADGQTWPDRKSTRLNSSHGYISYAVFCLKKKNNKQPTQGVAVITSRLIRP